MKQLVMIVHKIVWYTFVAISIIAFCAVGILLWKSPSFVADRINEYLVKEPEIIQIELKGIGIIGDSQSDEYRADDNRGSNYPNSTYNWVELLAQDRDLNVGTWSYYEESRRRGYEYNFSRSGATAKTMIDQGQHTKLAEYVKSGQVNTVIIFIGANDYAPFLYDNAYAAIYNGDMKEPEIIEKRNTIVAHIKTAVETLKRSGNPRIFVVTIPDWGDNTAVKIAFPLPHQRLRVTDAIRETNNDIMEMAHSEEVAVIDIQEFYRNLRTSENGYKVTVGDITLDQYIPQNNPRSSFLRDGIHTGTVVNGLLANYILSALNPHLSRPVELLSDEEILKRASLK